MALSLDQQTTLANEARRQELNRKTSSLLGQMDALASLASAISSISTDAKRQYDEAKAQLDALEVGAGPGISSDFGPYSTLEQSARSERFPGKQAAIDFIKANPACSEEEAQAAYRTAALAARPADRQWLLFDPASLLKEYAASAVSLQLIPDSGWSTFRNFVVTTSSDTLMTF